MRGATRHQSDAGVQIYEAQYAHRDNQSDKGTPGTCITANIIIIRCDNFGEATT